VHELTDGEGAPYLLFSLNLELGLDPTQPGALASLGLPAGWSYASRVLSEDLVIDSGGLATVFAQELAASYQRYAPVFEPGSALMYAAGLAVVARPSRPGAIGGPSRAGRRPRRRSERGDRADAPPGPA